MDVLKGPWCLGCKAVNSKFNTGESLAANVRKWNSVWLQCESKHSSLELFIACVLDCWTFPPNKDPQPGFDVPEAFDFTARLKPSSKSAGNLSAFFLLTGQLLTGALCWPTSKRAVWSTLTGKRHERRRLVGLSAEPTPPLRCKKSLSKKKKCQVKQKWKMEAVRKEIKRNRPSLLHL